MSASGFGSLARTPGEAKGWFRGSWLRARYVGIKGGVSRMKERWGCEGNVMVKLWVKILGGG